jgi:16S rRNA (guanine1207-N2)-methyltransferase
VSLAMSDHYFTAAPASPDARATLRVALAGRSVEVVTAPGIFSPRAVDKGTRVLLEEAPAPRPTGDFLDLGCGWGPIAITLALLSPEATVWAVDVNERALDLARVNAASLGLDRLRASQPDGVPADQSFDLIWSNPPIRVGKAVVHDLMTTWLPRLRPGGEAYLVVQKNLGADSLQAWLSDNLTSGSYAVSRHTTSGGFRILHVERRA